MTDEGFCDQCSAYVTQDLAPSQIWRDAGNWACPNVSDGLHRVTGVNAWQRMVDHEADVAADRYQTRCGW